MKSNSIDNIELSDLMSFVEAGEFKNTVDPAIAEYYELLEKIRCLDNRFKSKSYIIKHLIKLEGLTPVKAESMYADAINYFYADKKIKISAYRNKYADLLDKVIFAIIKSAKETKEYEYAIKAIEKAAKIRRTHLDDVEPKEEEFSPPVKIYTMDAKQAGIEKANRREIEQLLEKPELDLTEKEKDYLLRQAGIKDFKLLFDGSQED